jgi:hypothetical protein
MKEEAPNRNKIPGDFYEMKNLVFGLNLLVKKIDVHEWMHAILER